MKARPTDFAGEMKAEFVPFNEIILDKLFRNSENPIMTVNGSEYELISIKKTSDAVFQLEIKPL